MTTFAHRCLDTATMKRPARGTWRLLTISAAFVAMVLGLAAGPQLQAQEKCVKGLSNPCEDKECRTDFLQLSTGFDQSSNTTYNAGDKDNYWTITSDPAHGLTVPRHADVLKPAPIWPGPMGNSQWIGALPGNGQDDYLGDVTYERCFCVCDKEGKYGFDLDILVDDAAIVMLDGTVIAVIPAVGFPNPTKLNFGQVLGAGRHCLEVRVQNVKLPYAGLDIDGTVKGPGLIRDKCCATEEIPKDPCCQTDRVVIPTDQTWTITAGPAAFAPYPQCATIITNPNGAWNAPFGGTNWIGTSSTGAAGPWGPVPDTYVYHKSFCVEADGTYIITIKSMADDAGTIILNGVVIGNTGGFQAPVTQTFIVGLTKGCNCFDIRVDDIWFVVTGLDMNIDIQGGLLLKQECCDCAQCTAGHRAQHGNDGGNDGASSGVHNGNTTDASHPTLVSIPNPATGEAVVHYVLDRNADATVELFNSAGQRVMVVDQGARTIGQHAVPVVTKGLPAGAYRLRLKYDDHTLSIPMNVQ